MNQLRQQSPKRLHRKKRKSGLLLSTTTRKTFWLDRSTKYRRRKMVRAHFMSVSSNKTQIVKSQSAIASSMACWSPTSLQKSLSSSTANDREVTGIIIRIYTSLVHRSSPWRALHTIYACGTGRTWYGCAGCCQIVGRTLL